MREPRRLPTALLRVLPAAALLVWLMPAPAPGADVYTIRDVPVDETAATADEARRVAIESGEAEAWRRLVLRLVPGSGSGSVPQLSAAELDSLVQSLEIAGEKITADRYRALLTVRFRRDGVQQVLDRAGLAYASQPSPVLLVLPVLTGDGTSLLWEESNAWLEAWQRERGGGTMVDVVVPVGELADLVAIDASAALAGDWPAMQDIASRYEADGVLVAEARPAGEAMALDVSWYEGPEGRAVAIADDPALSGPGELGPERLAAAVGLVRQSLDAQWSAANTVPQGPEAILIAEIPIRDLAEWVEIRERLARPAALVDALPLVVSTGKVRVELRYVGTVDQLRAGLRQAGLELVRESLSWVILPL